VVPSSVDPDGTNRCVADSAATCDVYFCAVGGGSTCTLTTAATLKFNGTDDICTVETTDLVTFAFTTSSTPSPTPAPPPPTLPPTQTPTSTPTLAPPTPPPTPTPTLAPPTPTPTLAPPTPTPTLAPPTPTPTLAPPTPTPTPLSGPTVAQILNVADFQFEGFTSGQFTGDLNSVTGSVVFVDFTPSDATTPQTLVEIGSQTFGVGIQLSNSNLRFYAGAQDTPVSITSGITPGNRYTVIFSVKPDDPFSPGTVNGQFNIYIAENQNILEGQADVVLPNSLADNATGFTEIILSDNSNFGVGDTNGDAQGGITGTFTGTFGSPAVQVWENQFL